MIRGIPEELTTLLRIHSYTSRIVFPIFSTYNEKVGQVEQNIEKQSFYRSFIFKEYYGNQYIYGEQFLPALFYGKPVVIVEGVWDCLSLLKMELPVVAMCGCYLRLEQLKKIKRYTDKLIFLPDSDKAGEQGLNTMKKNLTNLSFQYRIYRNNSYKDMNDLLINDEKQFNEYILQLKENYNDFSSLS